MTVYDDTVQRPRTLPCGHTVCTMCVNKLKQLGRVACPECLVSHTVPEGGQFPVSYTVEAFIRMRGAEAAAAASPPPSVETRKGGAAAAGQKKAPGLSRKMRSILQEQEASAVAAITACQEVQAQLDQYQITLRGWGEQQQQLEDRLQGLLDQSRSARELVQQEESRASAMKEEAREGEQELHATLEALRTPATEQEARVAVGEVLRCTVEVKEVVEECQGSFPDANTATTVRKVREASKAALEAFQAALEAFQADQAAEEEPRPQPEAEYTIEDRLQAILTPGLKVSFQAETIFVSQSRAGTANMWLWASSFGGCYRKLYCMAAMAVLLITLLVSLLLVTGAGTGPGATGSPEAGCISRTALKTSTLQDEMDMWMYRHGYDIIVTVDHSGGSCQLRINDPALDGRWLHVRLSLKDNIEMTVDGTPFAPRRGCAQRLKMNTVKTVRVDNPEHLLPEGHEGPAIYQISQALRDVLIPWHEEEARLLLEPQQATLIGLQVGGQEFVVCSRGGLVAAQQDASACTAGVGTAAITLIIPKSNKYIKVITADGKEVETHINNAAKDVPPTVKKTLITGTVIMKQCMAHCNTGKGCTSRTALRKSTLQDEMDMWVYRHGKDVIVTVDHSAGSCQLRINDRDLPDKWLHVKLNLKDKIHHFIDGIPYAPRHGCVENLTANTSKTVRVDNAKHVLCDCHEGPAIYQISQALGDVLIPWHEEETRLLLEPQQDTMVGIEVGGQEFVVCSNAGYNSAQQDVRACTAGVGTSATTLIIPKSNKYIKVISADGKEAVAQITNGAQDVPPTVKKALINGTVIMKQCMANCNTAKHSPQVGPADIPEVGPADIPEAGSADIPEAGSADIPDDSSTLLRWLGVVIWQLIALALIPICLLRYV